MFEKYYFDQFFVESVSLANESAFEAYHDVFISPILSTETDFVNFQTV